MNEFVNKIFLSGHVVTPPVWDHTVLGESFYKLMLGAKRLSGAVDVLPVTVSERLLSGRLNSFDGEGKALEVTGQLRTYNQHNETGSHLIITVFARELRFPAEEEYFYEQNDIELAGRICKPVIYRRTPFQREISDLLVAVGRRYGKSDYLPCIAWGRNARYAAELQPGDAVSILGRLQSREYQKKDPEGSSVTRTAYEISCSSIEKQSL